MNSKPGILILASMCFVFFATQQYAVADELRYRPRNPSFGGSPLNGPNLISQATAQRKFNAPARERPSPVEQFSENIQRSIISRISRDISEAIIGENAKESGSFTVGGTVVDFKQQGNGTVLINISEDGGAASTTIEVPLPQF